MNTLQPQKVVVPLRQADEGAIYAAAQLELKLIYQRLDTMEKPTRGAIEPMIFWPNEACSKSDWGLFFFGLDQLI